MPERFLSYTGTSAADMGSVVVKPESPKAYTQTYSTAARVHVEAALATNLSLTLVTEVVPILNAQNKTINELKTLVNALIDDLQSVGVIS